MGRLCKKEKKDVTVCGALQGFHYLGTFLNFVVVSGSMQEMLVNTALPLPS